MANRKDDPMAEQRMPTPEEVAAGFYQPEDYEPSAAQMVEREREDRDYTEAPTAPEVEPMNRARIHEIRQELTDDGTIEPVCWKWSNHTGRWYIAFDIAGRTPKDFTLS